MLIITFSARGSTKEPELSEVHFWYKDRPKCLLRAMDSAAAPQFRGFGDVMLLKILVYPNFWEPKPAHTTVQHTPLLVRERLHV